MFKTYEELEKELIRILKTELPEDEEIRERIWKKIKKELKSQQDIEKNSDTEKKILYLLKKNKGLSPTQLITEMSSRGYSEPEIHHAMDYMIKKGDAKLTSDRKLKVNR